MKIAPFLLAAGLTLTTAVESVHADSLNLFNGAQFDLLGSWVVTAGTHLGDTGTFIGEFRLGSMVPSTTNWNVTALSAGGIDTGLALFTLAPGFIFNGSNDTLVGSGMSPTFLGGGGDTRQVTVTFINGNTITDTFINADMTNPANGRSGTFSYSITQVPEPATVLLLSLGLGGLAVSRRWRQA